MRPLGIPWTRPPWTFDPDRMKSAKVLIDATKQQGLHKWTTWQLVCILFNTPDVLLASYNVNLSMIAITNALLLLVNTIIDQVQHRPGLGSKNLGQVVDFNLDISHGPAPVCVSGFCGHIVVTPGQR